MAYELSGISGPHRVGHKPSYYVAYYYTDDDVMHTLRVITHYPNRLRAYWGMIIQPKYHDW